MINWSGKNVLVLGGAGFIGSHLVEKLMEADANVSVVDNLSTGSLDNLNRIKNRITFHKLDICMPELIYIIEKEFFDVIFHLAGNAYVPPSVKRPAWDYEINLHSTFMMIELLRMIKWQGIFIYASSAAVYGNPVRIPILENDPTVPISPYGVSKLAAERYTAVYSQLYGLKAASLRFFSMYGPRQQKQVVYDLIQKIMSNPQELFIYGDGTQTRDFTYVEDTARATMLVAELGALQGEVYNVASGQECSIHKLAQTLCQIMDVKPKFVYSNSIRPGDPDKWTGDISRLQKIGFSPIISLENGLKKVVNWYKNKINV